MNAFVSNPHGHPNFTPSRPVPRARTDIGVDIPKPKPPEKPIQPYMRYSKKVWQSVKQSHPDGKLWDIGKMIGQLWQDLPAAEKQVFFSEYESEKAVYAEQMKSYHNSPAYQSWFAAKNRGIPDTDELQRSAESRISIQHDDEDDIDESLSIKHIAALRYHRNHVLMAQIFPDIVLPDVRSVVTSQRLTVLKRHVESLSQQIGKLESELTDVKDNHATKLRKIEERSEAFESRYKEECSKNLGLSETEFSSLVERYRVELREQKRPNALTGNTNLELPPQQTAIADKVPISSCMDTKTTDSTAELVNITVESQPQTNITKN